jgi:hypothetical protein
LQETLGRREQAIDLWREARDLYASLNLQAGVDESRDHLASLGAQAGKGCRNMPP